MREFIMNQKSLKVAMKSYQYLDQVRIFYSLIEYMFYYIIKQIVLAIAGKSTISEMGLCTLHNRCVYAL